MQAVKPVPHEDLLAGRYLLEEQIGEGTFSITYRARDTTLGRTVALKMLRRQFAADQTFVSRFEREARAAASVAHPNVVDVFDYGADRGTFFIAMRFVPGRDLKRVLAEEGPLPTPEAVRITRQILRGLAAIHAVGIIHRDIKPQNVLLGEDGVARVADFGIAYGRVGDALTSHGTTVGTASYMAPEQARGGALSEATDLYAVGVVLFELLTGRLPFEAENPMAVMLAHLQRPVPSVAAVAPNAGIPPVLDAVVQRALAKDAAARYPAAGDFAQALNAAVAGGAEGQRVGRPAAPPAVRATVAKLPSAAPAGLGPDAATQAGVKAPVAIPPAPRRAVPGSLPVRRRRRERTWVGPVVFVGLALALLGGILAADLTNGGDGAEGSGGRGAGVGTPATSETGQSPPLAADDPTATSTAAPTRPAPTSAPSPSPTASPTATPEPTDMPVPPTETPRPTRTPTPTETPEPISAEPPSQPTIAPVGGAVNDSSGPGSGDGDGRGNSGRGNGNDDDDDDDDGDDD